MDNSMESNFLSSVNNAGLGGIIKMIDAQISQMQKWYHNTTNFLSAHLRSLNHLNENTTKRITYAIKELHKSTKEAKKRSREKGISDEAKKEYLEIVTKNRDTIERLDALLVAHKTIVYIPESREELYKSGLMAIESCRSFWETWSNKYFTSFGFKVTVDKPSYVISSDDLVDNMEALKSGLQSDRHSFDSYIQNIKTVIQGITRSKPKQDEPLIEYPAKTFLTIHNVLKGVWKEMKVHIDRLRNIHSCLMGIKDGTTSYDTDNEKACIAEVYFLIEYIPIIMEYFNWYMYLTSNIIGMRTDPPMPQMT